MFEILLALATLVAAFSSQVYLVKRLVAWAKEVMGIVGNTVRLVSFLIGALLGGLFLWPWIELNPGFNLSVYVLIGTLFLLIAGLTASGDYDLSVSDPENRIVSNDIKWRSRNDH